MGLEVGNRAIEKGIAKTKGIGPKIGEQLRRNIAEAYRQIEVERGWLKK